MSGAGARRSRWGKEQARGQPYCYPYFAAAGQLLRREAARRDRRHSSPERAPRRSAHERARRCSADRSRRSGRRAGSPPGASTRAQHTRRRTASRRFAPPRPGRCAATPARPERSGRACARRVRARRAHPGCPRLPASRPAALREKESPERWRPEQRRNRARAPGSTARRARFGWRMALPSPAGGYSARTERSRWMKGVLTPTTGKNT